MHRAWQICSAAADGGNQWKEPMEGTEPRVDTTRCDLKWTVDHHMFSAKKWSKCLGDLVTWFMFFKENGPTGSSRQSSINRIQSIIPMVLRVDDSALYWELCHHSLIVKRLGENWWPNDSPDLVVPGWSPLKRPLWGNLLVKLYQPVGKCVKKTSELVPASWFNWWNMMTDNRFLDLSSSTGGLIHNSFTKQKHWNR